ncbi:MAG: GcvT family protein [Chloroflexota bacterium]
MSEKQSSGNVPSTLPSHAQVVIVGGGVIGCSVAYHLTKLGWSDVVLLERKELTCGTTWHAAGLITSLRATENMTRLAKYTQDLYATLEEETGQATGFMRIGSLTLACTPERLEELRRLSSMARCFGVNVEECSAAQVKEMWPLARTDDVMAGFYIAQDARANPIDTTRAMAKGARMGGAKIFENTEVIAISRQNGRVTGVTTEQGEIQAEYVVNCGGMWGRELGKMAGVNVPLHAAEHYYLITETMEGMHPGLPILKDTDRYAYYREETGKLMLGLFEPVAAPWGMNGIPKQFAFSELPPDWERMTPYLEKAMARIPALYETGVQLLFNGPESFTPDDRYWLGESPELKNFYIAAGFNSLGILSAGGAGKVLAEWIVNGSATMNVWDVNINRMLPFQNNHKYLHDRTVEVLGFTYGNNWPFRQFESARNVRKSALHDRLAKAGACFGETAGWERANWYAPAGVEARYEYSFGRQNWFEYQAAEHKAAREEVILIDQSSFSKFFVQGRDAEKILNHICANNVAVPVGQCVYTQFLNQRGAIEADVTVTRIQEDVFMVITAPATHTHVLTWLKRNIGEEDNAFVTDVSSAFAMLNIQGPNSRELLSQLTDADLSNSSFPFSTLQEIDLAYARVNALRLSYVGELGWELYVPTEFVQSLYDALLEKGGEFGLKHAGYHTLNSLRIEKAYRDFGHDIGPDDTPLEAGLGFAVDFNKTDFIGREALLRQKEGGVLRHRLAQFILRDPEPLMYHAEPIYRDGEMVGHTSSAMYGHTLGASVALGYIDNEAGVTDDFVEAGAYEIEVAGERYPARASLKPLLDPGSKRIRC